MIGNNSFGKTERLCSAKVINELFENGRNFNNYPLRITWKVSEIQGPQQVKILISVPKKYLGKATDRNLIKRRIREAYRKNKQILYTILAEKKLISIDLAFIFAGKNIIEYDEIENKVIAALQNLIQFF